MALSGTARIVINLVHRAEVRLKSIVRDLPPIFEHFYSNEELRKLQTLRHRSSRQK